MGSDLSVVNAARASHARESKQFGDKDARLLRFLAAHSHFSPFRHAFITLEVKAPLLVARQWWKYVVASDHTMEAWNEASRRAITTDPEFYFPDRWYTDGDRDSQAGPEATIKLGEIARAGLKAYRWALDAGIAPEQARLMLPAYAMYTTWRWSASLQSLGHFLTQRLREDAQCAIREYAKAVRELVEPLFPVSLSVLAERQP
jgi:thymidylate synthase (FAD)